jgi:DNA-binding MarR family transcriptional regulator
MNWCLVPHVVSSKHTEGLKDMESRLPSRAGTAHTDEVLSVEEEAFFDAFLGAAMTVQRNVTADLLQEQNSTLSEHNALRHLAGAPGHRMRINELATAGFLSLSRMSRIVEKLEKQGLVDRAQVENDRRGWYAVLTDAGREWLERSEQSYASSVRRHALCMLDPASVRVLTAAARRLAALPGPMRVA